VQIENTERPERQVITLAEKRNAKEIPIDYQFRATYARIKAKNLYSRVLCLAVCLFCFQRYSKQIALAGNSATSKAGWEFVPS